jgi:hypothetical protein
MGISQEEDKDMEEKEAYKLEVEGHVGPPPAISKEDHNEQLMDVPKALNTYHCRNISNLNKTTKHFCCTCIQENV